MSATQEEKRKAGRTEYVRAATAPCPPRGMSAETRRSPPRRSPQSIRASPAEDHPGQLPGSPRVKAEVLPADQAEAPDLEHTLAWELHPTFLPAAF